MAKRSRLFTISIRWFVSNIVGESVSSGRKPICSQLRAKMVILSLPRKDPFSTPHAPLKSTTCVCVILTNRNTGKMVLHNVTEYLHNTETRDHTIPSHRESTKSLDTSLLARADSQVASSPLRYYSSSPTPSTTSYSSSWKRRRSSDNERSLPSPVFRRRPDEVAGAAMSLKPVCSDMKKSMKQTPRPRLYNRSRLDLTGSEQDFELSTNRQRLPIRNHLIGLEGIRKCQIPNARLISHKNPLLSRTALAHLLSL